MNKDKKIKKFFNKRRLLVLVFIGVIIIIIPFIGRVCYSKTDLVIATINNEPVTEREFKQVLSKQRSKVYQYFREKHGVDHSKDFWTNNYGGEIPIEVAKEHALDTITRIKIEQILAKDKGLMKDISYNYFLKELERENKRRKEAVANNRVIYGPVEYSESGYFQYIYSNMVLKVKKQLFQEKPDMEELEQFYECIKDIYKLNDLIKIQKISISISNGEGQNNQQTKKKAEDLLMSIKDQWNSYVHILNDSTNDEEDLKIDFEEVVLGKSYQSSEDSSNRVYEESTLLAVGEISNIIQDKDELVIIKILDIQPQGYRPLHEVLNHVQSRYEDEKYNTLIDTLVEKADITIQDSVYENIAMR